MKNKRNTGLRAGICRETQSTRGQTLLELLSAFLIFLALAAIFYTVSGFAAMLWLLGAGALTCIAAAAIRHFKKMKLLRLSDISEKRSCCSPSCWRHCCSLSCSRGTRC